MLGGGGGRGMVEVGGVGGGGGGTKDPAAAWSRPVEKICTKYKIMYIIQMLWFCNLQSLQPEVVSLVPRPSLHFHV